MYCDGEWRADASTQSSIESRTLRVLSKHLTTVRTECSLNTRKLLAAAIKNLNDILLSQSLNTKLNLAA